MPPKSSLDAPALLRLREPEVRSLCGGAAFSRGDAWQRAGHVGGPTAYADGLRADVRGTWRQVERVTVSVDAKGVHTSCPCGAGEYCRHAAAVLLHWVRSPRSFALLTPETYGDVPSLDEVLALEADLPEVESVRDELASLLELHTMADLREIARRRGLRGGGKNKVELTSTLALSLADPTNIDAALATLTGDECAMLQAIDLINADESGGHALGTAYHVLSGAEVPTEAARALHTLVGLGLAFTPSDWNHPSNQYTIPRVVAARLSRLADSPLSRLVATAVRRGTVAPPMEVSGLNLVEIVLVVVHEVVAGTIGKKLPVLPSGATIATSTGWMTEGPPAPRSRSPYGRSESTEMTLLPQPPSLSATDLAHLAERTGASVDMIDFAVEMLIDLEVIVGAGQGTEVQLDARDYMVYALLQLPPADRAAVLSETWLSLFDAFDFRSMSRRGTPLQLHALQLPFYAPLSMGEPASSDVRALMIRLLDHLSRDSTGVRWYDLPSWLDILWKLTPELLGTAKSPLGEWWFTGPSGNETRLDLATREGWAGIVEPLMEWLLLGPLTWLRLVDTSIQEDGTLSFRPCPQGAEVLPGSADTGVPLPDLLLRVDPQSGAPDILVPAGYPDLTLHRILAETTDLADISPAGLRYRLTRERAQEAFDAGGTAPDLLALLAERSRGPVPDDVLIVLNTWWKSYGNVRLYDDLTLIELDDDILLQELLATSSLRGALLDVITPRLVAVQPAAVQTLLGEMERLGYTPRVREDE